nr:YqjK family protein [uncultured Roseateles sp.]
MASEQERLLQLRQMALRLRSAELRMQLTQEAEALRAPLALADQGRQLLLWLRARPAWTAGGAAGLLALLTGFKPRRLLRWAGRGLRVWRWVARLRGFLRTG